MRRLIVMASAIMISTVLLAGCGSDKQTRSMEQIYAEEGVPVKTEQIGLGAFVSELSYNGTLTGSEESSEYAMLSDKIEKIYASVGDQVSKDDIIISFPTDNPAAKYYQAKVAFEFAEASFKRYENLFQTGGISRQQLENAQTSFEVARADWDAVRQAVRVKAPMSGILSKINARESDNVEKDDELFTISNITRMKAKVWVPERDISLLSRGQAASAVWNGIRVEGKVVQVDLSINKARQAFGVTLEFDNPGRIAQSGITAGINIYTYSRDSAIVIKRKNILTDSEQPYVYVANGGQAHRRAVTLGNSNGLEVEIVSGLEPGDSLITEGQLLLGDGKKIKVINSQPALNSASGQSSTVPDKSDVDSNERGGE